MSQGGILNISAAGGGNVTGPGSSVDGDIAVFSGTTGKIIRDSGVNISSSAATLGTVTINNTASSGTGYVVDNGTNSGAAGAFFTAIALGGDALLNLDSFTKYQIGSNHSDGNLYVTTTPGSTAQLGGTNLIKIETINNVNFGKGRISTFGGQVVLRKTVPAHSAAMNNEDYYIGVTDSSTPRTITLPSVASLLTGQMFIIKDEGGLAAANNITVQPADAVNIDGAATYVIAANYGSVQIIFNGSSFNAL